MGIDIPVRRESVRGRDGGCLAAMDWKANHLSVSSPDCQEAK